jgi:hypothetical protein
MAPAFQDARMRLDRAKANRERLKNEMAAWRTAHPEAHRVVIQGDPQSIFRVPNDNIVRLVARITEQPPKEWGLLVGDILGDLRSALDYAIYALAIAHTGNDPPLNADALEFPIAKDPTWFHSQRAQRKIEGLSKTARDYIEQIQPYQSGYGGPAGQHVNSPLWVLNELVRVSKHRFLHVFWTKLHSTQLQIDATGLGVTQIKAYKIDGELKDGAVLADLTLAKSHVEKKGQVTLSVSLTPYIAFEATSALPSTEIYSGLGKIGGPIEDVLNHLEALV